MATVTSKITINQPLLDKLDAAAKKALYETADALKTEIVNAGVIPRMTGELSGEGFWVDSSELSAGKVFLVNSTPYARRWYFNPNGAVFHQSPWQDKDGKTYDGNPNAKDHWFEDWEENGKEKDFVPDTFKAFYKKESGLSC